MLHDYNDADSVVDIPILHSGPVQYIKYRLYVRTRNPKKETITTFFIFVHGLFNSFGTRKMGNCLFKIILVQKLFTVLQSLWDASILRNPNDLTPG